jgi:hypothetical protein
MREAGTGCGVVRHHLGITSASPPSSFFSLSLLGGLYGEDSAAAWSGETCASSCRSGSSPRMGSMMEASPSGARPLDSSHPSSQCTWLRLHSCLAMTGGVGSRDSDFGYGQLLEGQHPWKADGAACRRGAGQPQCVRGGVLIVESTKVTSSSSSSSSSLPPVVAAALQQLQATVGLTRTSLHSCVPLPNFLHG